ncbi:hypothetical protein [Propionibacterium australiense]|uniref:Uncharacterized protein n=1 Tax=Propionibacterium australiense TaxID=119981 RepID=A0A383S4E1_9ACTN|nr:hypothetical protein [Propionibacterium australiense]RLP10659.1 hypothetical protein D9T14_05285 [Propionibacterium australiense]SYZ32865.1 Hypothetical protein PROPAUS_0776 [Propionibacterium australiense]VEH91089.1 Uncharacterised protein [Propionibacterium australiense]
MRLTIDRLPVLIVGVLFLVCLPVAEWVVRQPSAGQRGPFVNVWQVYDHDAAVRLVAAIVVGALIALVLPLGRGLTLAEITERTREPVGLLTPLWVWLGLAIIAANALSKGRYLFFATEYLMTWAPHMVVVVAGAVLPVLPMLAGLIGRRHPVLGLVFLAASVVFMFGAATRVLCGVIVLYLLGRVLGGRPVPWWGWLGGLAFALCTLPIPLNNRGQATHGLVPYWEATTGLVTDPDYLSSIGSTFAENIAFIVPLVIYCSKVPWITLEHLLVELNPLPSGMAGWPEIADEMRVHTYIPFSAVGEWASLWGIAGVIGSVVFFGLLTRCCLLSLGRNTNATMPVALAAGIALGVIAAVQFCEYNTRMTMRIQDFLVALAVLERIARPWVDAAQARLAGSGAGPGGGSGLPPPQDSTVEAPIPIR